MFQEVIKSLNDALSDVIETDIPKNIAILTHKLFMQFQHAGFSRDEAFQLVVAAVGKKS